MIVTQIMRSKKKITWNLEFKFVDAAQFMLKFRQLLLIKIDKVKNGEFPINFANPIHYILRAPVNQWQKPISAQGS